jgi:hypothetical protein
MDSIFKDVSIIVETPWILGESQSIFGEWYFFVGDFWKELISNYFQPSNLVNFYSKPNITLTFFRYKSTLHGYHHIVHNSFFSLL